MRRRSLLGMGAGALAAGPDLLFGCANGLHSEPGGGEGVGYFARFGVDERMIREALATALARGGDSADVYFQHTVATDLDLEDGTVNRGTTTVQLGVGVRAVKGDQTGYGYTEELTRESLRRCAATAATVADGPARAAPGRLHVQGKLPRRYPVRLRWDEVSIDQKLPLLTSVNGATFQADPRITKVSINYTDESTVILLATSDGRIVEDARPMTNLYLSCVAEHEGQREWNFAQIGGRHGIEGYSRERLDQLAREAVGRTLLLFEAVSPGAGEMPVVLAAGSSGILLHEAIGHSLEADFNRKKISLFADRMGRPVARPFVNIVDDGTLAFARGSINVDDEGNVPGKTTLVEGGALTSFLHDAVSARACRVPPTGNGRRESYRHVPLPRMRATYMLPGPHRREEIIASVKRGIFCESFTGGQVQIGAGDFTFFVKNGHLIENGKLTRPIKDVNIIGNGPRVLERMDMVADDLAMDEGGWSCGKDGQLVPVSLGIPTVRIPAMTVGGKGAS